MAIKKSHGQPARTQYVQNPLYLLNDTIWRSLRLTRASDARKRVRVSHKKAPGPAVQASRHSFDGSQRKYYHIFRKRGGMVPRYVQKEAIGFPCRHQHFMLQYA